MAHFSGEPEPYEWVRLQVCEKMGWTFKEYDDTPAVDLYESFELWKHADLLKDKRVGKQKA